MIVVDEVCDPLTFQSRATQAERVYSHTVAVITKLCSLLIFQPTESHTQRSHSTSSKFPTPPLTLYSNPSAYAPIPKPLFPLTASSPTSPRSRKHLFPHSPHHPAPPHTSQNPPSHRTISPPHSPSPYLNAHRPPLPSSLPPETSLPVTVHIPSAGIQVEHQHANALGTDPTPPEKAAAYYTQRYAQRGGIP